MVKQNKSKNKNKTKNRGANRQICKFKNATSFHYAWIIVSGSLNASQNEDVAAEQRKRLFKT